MKFPLRFRSTLLDFPQVSENTDVFAQRLNWITTVLIVILVIQSVFMSVCVAKKMLEVMC